MSEMGAVGPTRRLVGCVGPKLKKQMISGECILSNRRLTYMNFTAFFVAVQRNMITKWSKTQSDLTKRPHRRRTWTVQSYSPGGHQCSTV